MYVIEFEYMKFLEDRVRRGIKIRFTYNYNDSFFTHFCKITRRQAGREISKLSTSGFLHASNEQNNNLHEIVFSFHLCLKHAKLLSCIRSEVLKVSRMTSAHVRGFDQPTTCSVAMALVTKMVILSFTSLIMT